MVPMWPSTVESGSMRVARRYCARLTATSSRVGVAVILVFRSRLLPEAEPEIGAALAGYLAEEVITVLGDLAYKAVRRTEVGVTLTVRRNGRRGDGHGRAYRCRDRALGQHEPAAVQRNNAVLPV